MSECVKWEWMEESSSSYIFSLFVPRLHRYVFSLLLLFFFIINRNHILYLLSLEIKSRRHLLIFRMACALICCTDIMLFAVSFLSRMHGNIHTICDAIQHVVVVFNARFYDVMEYFLRSFSRVLCIS